MSEVNYRRNGMKYSTTGKCWGMAPKAGGFASDLPAKGHKPKSSRERRAASGGKYVSYSLSVRLKDREEMARLDAAIAGVPGLKMCL